MAVIVLKEKLKIDEIKNHEKTLSKTDLFFSGRFRWNIFVLLLALGLIILPVFTPIVVTFAINCIFLLQWFIYLTLNTYGNFKIWRKFNRNKIVDVEKGVSKTAQSKYKYIMVTFCYKEPLGMLRKNLNMVSSLNGGDKVIMVVCLEEKTPQLEEKIRTIEKEFDGKFAQLIITVHPFGVEGDIPGKCSNSNFGIRSLYNYLKEQDPNLNQENYVLTNFDVDTMFHKNFLDILDESVVENEAKLSRVVFQPLLYYNWDLAKFSFFTRCIGIMRSTMMCGALVPFNLNVMSIYSASLKLWVDGGFTHPFYQMEDIICYIRWTAVSKRYLSIQPIYSPTLSGPTSGENWRQELTEMFRQGKRWAIGSAEVFHYFMCKLKKMNLFYAFIWALSYLNYYVVVLCAQNLMIFTTTLRLSVLEQSFDYMNLVFLTFPIIYYAFNLWMIVVNKVAVNTFLKELGVEEKLGFFRQLLHWLLCFPTQIIYSLIVLYGFVEILFLGKDACTHKASKKENLVKRLNSVQEVVRKLSTTPSLMRTRF